MSTDLRNITIENKWRCAIHGSNALYIGLFLLQTSYSFEQVWYGGLYMLSVYSNDSDIFAGSFVRIQKRTQDCSPAHSDVHQSKNLQDGQDLFPQQWG